MKIISWNIDSINAALTSDSARALLSRGVLDNLVDIDPDVLAIQETKLSSNGPSKKHLEILNSKFPDYEIVWNSSVEPARKGYAGTMFLYKKELDVSVSYPKIGAPSTMDFEGRIITLEFNDFYLTEVYTPNAGTGLVRLKDREKWDDKYLNYLLELDSKKSVIATGDFNVAHNEIDLAHPKQNHFSPGFTDEERLGFSNIVRHGFIDTFRYINGDIENVYSWWSQRAVTSKTNNSGWRIDYFLVSDRIKEKVSKSNMIDTGSRADHAPILLKIDI